MTTKQTLLLAVPTIALCFLGAVAMRLSTDLAERSRADSIAELLAGALDNPSKLSLDHVRTVIGAARTIEDVGRRGELAMADSIASIARACFMLAAMSVLSIVLVARQQSARRREARTDGFSVDDTP
jgi:hypothetical protein